MTKIRDLTGQRFGRLTVIQFVKIQNRKAWFLCKCDCGNEVTTAGVYLTGKKSRTRSCGCLLKEAEINNGRTVGRNNLLGYIKTIKKPAGESSRNHLFYLYKYKADKRNIEFKLSIEEFAKLTKGNCYYCGAEPSQIKEQKSTAYIYNGIDRVDNTKGYVLDNCVPCCKMCNYAKSNMTMEEFLIWINRVYHYQNRDDYLYSLERFEPSRYENETLGLSGYNH